MAKRNWLDLEPRGRPFCWRCRKPKRVCYCHLIKPFDAKIEFVILIHPDEARRHIASARMAHLNLQNSYLVVGEDFSKNSFVSQLLDDPGRSNWLLFPGQSALPLEKSDSQQLFWQTVGPQKQATVIVIDGTWRKVGRMINSRPELYDLPRLAFQPPHPSEFQIRKQPADYCWSTLEAIAYVIERCDAAPDQQASVLKECFLNMVDLQQQFEKQS